MCDALPNNDKEDYVEIPQTPCMIVNVDGQNMIAIPSLEEEIRDLKNVHEETKKEIQAHKTIMETHEDWMTAEWDARKKAMIYHALITASIATILLGFGILKWRTVVFVIRKVLTWIWTGS